MPTAYRLLLGASCLRVDGRDAASLLARVKTGTSVSNPFLIPHNRSNRRCSSSVSEVYNLSTDQARTVDRYLSILLEQNRVMNLTAVQTPEAAWTRHVQDSLALLPVLERNLPRDTGSRPRLMDLGSGAGLPGIILAIARPEWQLTLLDSLKKRCSFLEHAVGVCELSNVQVVWARAEAAGRSPQLREAFHGVVARAVAELRSLVELSLPLVRVGGSLIAAKGPTPEAEVEGAAAAIAALGGELGGIEPVASFSSEGQRTAVVIRKVRPSPNAYPRREGQPQKRPL